MEAKRFLKLLFAEKDANYSTLDNKTGEYFKNFGLKWDKKKKVWYPPDKACGKKVQEAYNRAIQNRDFEINKFWSRAAYFWGFIVLIFGAYWQVRKGDDPYMEMVVICLGLIFSIGWYYVIEGSKHWQENWEAHIDSLEDFITGPIYKTIRYKGTYHSVSKITAILSISIIAIWTLLLGRFLQINNYLPWGEGCRCVPDWTILITLLVSAGFICSIVFGYARKTYTNEKDTFIIRNK